MRGIVSVATIVALLAISVAATKMGLKTVVVPRTTGAGFSEVCDKNTCPPGSGSCDWCPDDGPYCNRPGYSCCGCYNTRCWICPSDSSCADWVPTEAWECSDTLNSDNSTRWGSCRWLKNFDLEDGGWSVLRCHSIDRDVPVTIKWDVTFQPGTFYTSIFDQANFFKFQENSPYSCLNEHCGNDGPSPHQYGSVVASGSTDYYVVTFGFKPGNYQVLASVA